MTHRDPVCFGMTHPQKPPSRRPFAHRRMRKPFPPGPRPPRVGTRPQAEQKHVPSPLESSPHLRVMVLGGCEEVGRNCTMLEYGNDIMFIDMGLQFPEEDMPGVDYIIPNLSSVKGKEKNIRGVVITHGHYDHIGGIPHVVPHIGNPPVYALPVAAGIIKKRQQDFHTRPINLKSIKVTDTLKLGAFQVSFLHINHNIPDSVAVVIETPVGVLVHTGDWKFDFHPAGDQMPDFHRIAEIGQKGVLALFGDSTNANKPGHQISEKVIGEELESIIEKAPGRVIIGTFASLLSRVKQVIEISEKLGRKIALNGYSMKTNVEIAKELGYIKCHRTTFITPEQVDHYPPEKIVICCTGAQGERNAALNRIANNEHPSLRIQPDDTVVFSSSIVPGNEQAVQRLKDTLCRKGARILNYEMMDVHAGGHAKKEDVKLLLALLRPTYYIPIEGNHFLLRENAQVAYEMGWNKEHVFVPDNGQVMLFARERAELTREKVPTDYVFVDGLGVGDISEVVLRDRQVLAEDGMVVIVVQVDEKTGALVGSPDIISRGFIFMKENKEIIEEVRHRVKKAIVDKDPKSAADNNYIRNQIRAEIGKFLFQKTERRPMVLPVLIEV